MQVKLTKYVTVNFKNSQHQDLIYHCVIFWKLGIVTVKHLSNGTLAYSCIT